MTNSPNKNFDLEDRTARFGEGVIIFCKSISDNTVNKPLVNQLVRSGTSIGANYCEANGAGTKKDFKNKIHICQKEAKETKHWLRMIATAVPEKREEAQTLWKECNELSLIFGRITHTMSH